MKEFIRSTQYLTHTVAFHPLDKAEFMFYVRRKQPRKKKDAIAILYNILGIKVVSNPAIPEGVCVFLDSKGNVLHTMKFNQH